jgi:hypothetical protein
MGVRDLPSIRGQGDCLCCRQIAHPHSSSASRFTAGAAGFLNLSQCRVRPLTYGEPSRFDTMPSQPSLQAWR